MTADGEGTGFFSQFKRQFWLVNAMELFERGSYYAFMSVYSLHLVYNLGGSEELPGLLYAPMIGFLYFVPILSAALAEKIGYRKILIGAFLMMIVGYSSMIFVDNVTAFIGISIVFMGIGAGAFKPMISATIAHITREEQRNLAYSVYYWMINLGATIFPLSLTFYLYVKYPGIPWEELPIYGAPLIFTVSTIFVTVNLALAFFLYREPVEAKPDISLSQAVMKIKPALQDRKFALLLVIYSGFWFMFAFNHTYLPLYMYQFAKMPAWFTVTLLAVVNPATIIMVGPFLARLVEKRDSLKMMILGILLFCIGLMIVAFSLSPAMFVAGIVVFSVGEFITHPNFISYVSKFAPKDKVAIYMACIFLPIGVGNIAGGLVQSQLYKNIAVGLESPKLYIACVAAVGIVTAVLFILYNRWRFDIDVTEGKRNAGEGGFIVRPVIPLLVLAIAPLVVIAGAYGSIEEIVRTGGFGEDEVEYEWEDAEYTFPSISGNVNENSEVKELLNMEQYRISSITVSMTWDSEEISDWPRGTNEPDYVGFILEDPDGNKVGEEQPSAGGSVSKTYQLEEAKAKDAYSGEWTITIVCGDCGDDSGGVLGIVQFTEDTSSFYSVEITIKYQAQIEKK